MTEILTFDAFGLNESILKALKEAGFVTPSPIQQEVIPQILAGRDLIGQAQTGTGKTAAFGLPALHLIQKNPSAQLLVLTPTRELATQVGDEIYRFGRLLGIRTATICGGKSFKAQTEAVRRGVQVLVATPGRLLDLLQSKELPDLKPSIVVLDEADEMLDMGFLDDIRSIFKFLPTTRQTLLFSATMPKPIQNLAKDILKNPLMISVTPKETTNQDIKQMYYVIHDDERDDAIVRLIDSENPKKAIIFCKTKKDVDRLTQLLLSTGHLVRGLHGDMEQPQREEVIRAFRSEHLRLLVATDVAARGLNIQDISHVFNYHLPFDPSSYVHRIGRTGRAGNKGVAGTFVTLREWRDFQRYEKVLGTRIQRGEIPSLQEVIRLKRHQLADQILSQSLHEDVDKILDIMQKTDVKEIASKLISFMLHQQVILGPDRIGVEPRHVERSKSSADQPQPRREKQREPSYSKSSKRFRSNGNSEKRTSRFRTSGR